jgi:hypothetical protein
MLFVQLHRWLLQSSERTARHSAGAEWHYVTTSGSVERRQSAQRPSRAA